MFRSIFDHPQGDIFFLLQLLQLVHKRIMSIPIIIIIIIIIIIMGSSSGGR